MRKNLAAAATTETSYAVVNSWTIAEWLNQ